MKPSAPLTPLANPMRYAFYHCDVARFRTAVGHVVGPGRVRAARRLRLPECMSPAGASLTMSAADLLRFGLLHLRGGLTEEGGRLLSAGSAASMSAPVEATGADVGTELLLGWAALRTDRGRLVAASGATIGQNAFLAILPDAGMALAILANTGGGAHRLALGMGGSLFRKHAGAAVSWPSPPPWPRERPRFDAARYVGEYTNHTRLSVSDMDGGLLAVLSAWDPENDQVVEQPFVLDPLGEDRFGPRTQGGDGPAAVFRFVFQDGAARAGHVVQAGRVFARCDTSGWTDVGVA